ncbi:MAG: hypothetical protein AUJ52_03275 [Elusimicrobia bacterium CG1_02_63_36]|nr:MAG: hypothetical protein AUJ52_03275 [Elusimicrobia bacterium CG1_02_63_36]
MSPWLTITVGLFFFLLGLGYLYKPSVIERINAILRETLLNDAYIALERRKWGVFFLLLSLLFLYLGYASLYGPV